MTLSWLRNLSDVVAGFAVATAVVFVAGAIGGGCQCYEDPERGWEFRQPVDGAAFDVPLDTEPDLVDTRDTFDVPPDVVDVDVEDAIDPDGFSPPTNVIDNSNCGGRTSLVVDSNGTEWIGFHRSDSQSCDDQMVTVAHHRSGSRQWQFEEIAEQYYLQVLAVNEPDRPIVVYPGANEGGEFRVSRRRPNGSWREYTLPVSTSVLGSPGFDTAADEDHYYVSFAGDQSTRVEFFAFDTTAPGRGWERRGALFRSDPRAALERGLRADLGDSAYLVHRDDGGTGPFGLARYDKTEDRWPQTEYFDTSDLTVHSLEVTEDFELCMSGDIGRLVVTCGSMVDLDAERWEFRKQPEIERIPPSSMAVGADGSLYVAYHLATTAELRVAKLPPDSSTWRITTIFDDETSGVSTDVAPDGRLIVSFFACDEPDQFNTCPLKVVREAPDNL